MPHPVELCSPGVQADVGAPASSLPLPGSIQSVFNPKQWLSPRYALLRLLHMLHLFPSQRGKNKQKKTQNQKRRGQPPPQAWLALPVPGRESSPLHLGGDFQLISHRGTKRIGKEKLSSWIQRLLIKKLNRKQIKWNREFKGC